MNSHFFGIVPHLDVSVEDIRVRINTLMQYVLLSEEKKEIYYSVEDLAQAYLIFAYILNNILDSKGEKRESIDRINVVLLSEIIQKLNDKTFYDTVKHIVESIPQQNS